MSADQWTSLWIVVLAGGSGSFALLAIIVAIGGFRDVKAMFRRIDAEHAQSHQRDPAAEPRTAADQPPPSGMP
jgi:hypothetical protein